MDYKIYEKSKLLHDGINDEGKETMFTLFFTMGHFSFCVVYKPDYFGTSLRGLAHFDFYALTLGFEGFTSTGYRSCFEPESYKVASYEEIKAYFMDLFKGKVAFLEDKPVQLGLF